MSSGPGGGEFARISHVFLVGRSGADLSAVRSRAGARWLKGGGSSPGRAAVDTSNVNIDPAVCFECRRQLRSILDRYCAHHSIDPPYRIRAVFDRRQVVASGPTAGEVVTVARELLVDLDDDEAWVRFCPCDRRWWDVDLYPELAATEGVVGLTASPDPGDQPAVAPGGIFVHRDPAVLR